MSRFIKKLPLTLPENDYCTAGFLFTGRKPSGPSKKPHFSYYGLGAVYSQPLLAHGKEVFRRQKGE